MTELSNFANSIAAQAREEAELAIAPFQNRADQLVAALLAVDVKDDEDMRRAVDKLALAKALREAADAALQPIGRPYRDASHAVVTIGGAFMARLMEQERHATRQIDGFRTRQREAAARARNEQEERERELRRQAGLEVVETAPIQAAEVRLPSVRSDYRGHAFDRKVLKVQITDPRALPDEVLKSPGVTAALETAVRRLAGLTRDIPGATVTDDLKTSVKAG